MSLLQSRSADAVLLLAQGGTCRSAAFYERTFGVPRCSVASPDDTIVDEKVPIAWPSSAPPLWRRCRRWSTATVFSTTFLSARVRGEAQRAVDRSIKLGDELADRGAANGSETRWLDEQVSVLRHTLTDRFPLVLIATNVVLALLVVGLAVGFGLDAGARPGAGPSFWALMAFGGTATLVVAVGTTDVLLTRIEVHRHLDDKPMEKALLAYHALRAVCVKADAVNDHERAQGGVPRGGSSRSWLRQHAGLTRPPQAFRRPVLRWLCEGTSSWRACASPGIRHRPRCSPPTGTCDGPCRSDRSSSRLAARAFAAELFEDDVAAVDLWRQAHARYERAVRRGCCSTAARGDVSGHPSREVLEPTGAARWPR